ncbi:hypothetical protein CRUP_012986 [Coryphaenoides rupestris]|nr:hypothetical protein CRUP_012986 [Coryphaenoides rupestris]
MCVCCLRGWSMLLHVHTTDAFVKITRHEGARSLWSGLPPTLVMAVPATVIYFTCYDQLRDCLRPLELVRTKMQSRKLTYAELTVCIRSSVARGGWLSLWKGWGPTVLRDVPFSALYWFNYELVKARLHEQQQQHLTNFSISFAAGAISGSVAAILTLPFDVVKTRRQIQLGEMETLGVPLARTSSTWHILKDIWTESGHRGLFAGRLF